MTASQPMHMYVSLLTIAPFMKSRVFSFVSGYTSGANAHGPNSKIGNLGRTDRIYCIWRAALVIHEAERLFICIGKYCSGNPCDMLFNVSQVWDVFERHRAVRSANEISGSGS